MGAGPPWSKHTPLAAFLFFFHLFSSSFYIPLNPYIPPIISFHFMAGPSTNRDEFGLTSAVNPFAGQNIGYFRLAVVGDSGVGKTSFARQFTETLPEVLSHDWEPTKDDDEDDYTRTEALIEKFSSTMMEIPWDNMDADDEVPARNLVFVGKYASWLAQLMLLLTHANQFLFTLFTLIRHPWLWKRGGCSVQL